MLSHWFLATGFWLLAAELWLYIEYRVSDIHSTLNPFSSTLNTQNPVLSEVEGLKTNYSRPSNAYKASPSASLWPQPGHPAPGTAMWLLLCVP